MIGRSARCFRIDTSEPMLSQIEPLDKDVNHANRIVLANPFFQAFRKQRALPAIRALNEAPHPILPRIISRESHKRGVFTQPGSISTELADAKRRFVSAVPPIATDSVPRNERRQRAQQATSRPVSLRQRATARSAVFSPKKPHEGHAAHL